MTIGSAGGVEVTAYNTPDEVCVDTHVNGISSGTCGADATDANAIGMMSIGDGVLVGLISSLSTAVKVEIGDRPPVEARLIRHEEFDSTFFIVEAPERRTSITVVVLRGDVELGRQHFGD